MTLRMSMKERVRLEAFSRVKRGEISVGTCGLCLVEIVEGMENLSEVTAEEQDVLATPRSPDRRAGAD